MQRKAIHFFFKFYFKSLFKLNDRRETSYKLTSDAQGRRNVKYFGVGHHLPPGSLIGIGLTKYYLICQINCGDKISILLHTFRRPRIYTDLSEFPVKLGVAKVNVSDFSTNYAIEQIINQVSCFFIKRNWSNLLLECFCATSCLFDNISRNKWAYFTDNKV